MPRYTRRRRGGGLLNMFKGKPSATETAVANLEAQKNAAMRKSKSRVANVLSAPGTVVYTNKNRIAGEFDAKFKELMSQIENPQESASALKSVITSVETALKSQTARQTGAVVITIPVFVAQLFVKVGRVLLAIIALFFVFFATRGELAGDSTAGSNLVGTIFPNTKFNTTARAYNAAKRFTGVVNSAPTVQDY